MSTHFKALVISFVLHHFSREFAARVVKSQDNPRRVADLAVRLLSTTPSPPCTLSMEVSILSHDCRIGCWPSRIGPGTAGTL
jgi:hypothetical protein